MCICFVYYLRILYEDFGIRSALLTHCLSIRLIHRNSLNPYPLVAMGYGLEGYALCVEIWVRFWIWWAEGMNYSSVSYQRWIIGVSTVICKRGTSFPSGVSVPEA